MNFSKNTFILKNVFLLVLLVVFISCGKVKQQSTSTSLSFKGVANLGTMVGGVMVYGVGPRNFAMALADEESNAEINLPTGFYTFYTIGWEGPGKMEGNPRCSVVTAQIDGPKIDVGITLARANCDSSVFTMTTDKINSGASVEFKKIRLNSCKTLDNALFGGSPTITTKCDATNPTLPYLGRGSVRSYKIRLKAHHSNTGDLESSCFNAPVNANTSAVLTDVRIPQSPQINYGMEVLSYKSFDCSDPNNLNYSDEADFLSFGTFFPKGPETKLNAGTDVLKVTGAAVETVLFLAETQSGSGKSPFPAEIPYITNFTNGDHIFTTNTNFTSVPIRAYTGRSYQVKVPNSNNLIDFSSCTVATTAANTSNHNCTCDSLKCIYSFNTTSNFDSAATVVFAVQGKTTSGWSSSVMESLYLNFKTDPNDGFIKYHENVGAMIGWPSIFNPNIGFNKDKVAWDSASSLMSAEGAGGYLFQLGFTSCLGINSSASISRTFDGVTKNLSVYNSTSEINPFTNNYFQKKIQSTEYFSNFTKTEKISFDCSTKKGHFRSFISGVDNNSVPFSSKIEYIYNLSLTTPVIHFYQRDVRNTTQIFRRYAVFKKGINKYQIWQISGDNTTSGGETFYGFRNHAVNLLCSLSDYHANNTSSIINWIGSTTTNCKNLPNYTNTSTPNTIGSLTTLFDPTFTTPTPIKNSGRVFDMNWLKNQTKASDCVSAGSAKSLFDCDLE
jgi:hypothetical protein